MKIPDRMQYGFKIFGWLAIVGTIFEGLIIWCLLYSLFKNPSLVMAVGFGGAAYLIYVDIMRWWPKDEDELLKL